MLADMTLGQYYPAQSPVHRLDPRVKLMLTLAFIIDVFLIQSMWMYAPLFAFVLLIARLSHVPLKYFIRGIRPLRFILIFTFIINMLFSASGDVWLSVWVITVTRGGVMTALRFSLRLVLLVLASSLLTLTTPPMTLTDGLERLLSPLRVIRFPAHEMAMMMTIALRFIPTLTEEADKIMKAQTARGADFESGSLIKRARAMVPLLVPLFVSAFRRASDLALAMEARCYHGGEGRTRLRVLKCARGDYGAMACMIAVTAVVVLSTFILEATF